MSSSTLKLPKKSATSTRTGDSRASSRKPIRGGSKSAQHAAPRRAESVPATASRLPEERSAANIPVAAAALPRRTPDSSAGLAQRGGKINRDPPAVNPQRNGGASASGASDAATTVERPAKPARAYPPRGIARSTGARALPPTRQSDGEAPPVGTRESLPATRTHLAANAVAEVPPKAADKPPRGLAKEFPRLSKLVAEQAACSRREADEWIENGWVSVDGAVVARLGARINPKARIEIAAAAEKHAFASVTILYNKPCGQDSKAGENATASLTTANRWPEDRVAHRLQATHLRGLAPIARLEVEEAGMLVLTQEGSVARRLTGGDTHLEREYHVRVDGELTPEGLTRLRHGLSIDGIKLKPAQVSWLSEQLLRFVLHENRPGQIREMCRQVGLQATEIKRVRIGSISLGKLAPGQWRFLRPDERF